MAGFLYHFFHNETNDRTERGLVNIPEDIEDWPQEWKEIEHKRYLLLRPVPLPEAQTGLFELLSRRRSDKDSVLGNVITLAVLAKILQCGYGLQKTVVAGRSERRTVPSAGQRYPLEIYPVLFKDIDGCKAGIYHYGVREHVLEPVTADGFTRDELLSYIRQEWLADVTGVICISAVLSRTTGKYGSRGYRYILLEAGHAAQNMLLAGTENDVNMVPVGGANEVDFERKIGLMDSNERIMYMLFF
ncbi:MAG: SagB/ThcOx family dehydrogenase [Candidatus Moraniibacteriota bacterium]